MTYNKKRELLFPLSLFAVQIYGIYGSFAIEAKAEAKAKEKERKVGWGKGEGQRRELAKIGEN